VSEQAPTGTTADQRTVKPPCTAQTRHGKACRAFARPERPFCQVHDPQRQLAFRRACSKGGTLRALQGKRANLRTMNDLTKFNARIIGDVLDGTLASDTARTLIYALTLQHRLVEGGHLEERLAALEERLAASPPPLRGAHRWAT
jgi:hypothetical protein